jgi:hypothetical protein
MAYLHCHSCDWSQDDFWNWKWTLKFWESRPFGYNPLSLIIEDFKRNIKPYYINVDPWFLKETGIKSTPVHSWKMLLWNLKRHIKRLFTQRWWTYKSWLKDKDIAYCPCCGKRDFDID